MDNLLIPRSRDGRRETPPPGLACELILTKQDSVRTPLQSVTWTDPTRAERLRAVTTSFAPVPSLTDTNNRESGWHGAAELHIKPRRRAGGRIKQRGWSVQNSAVGGVHGSRCRPAHEWQEASTSQDSLATGFPGSGRWRRIRGRRCGTNFISCRWLGSCAPLTISSLYTYSCITIY